MSFTRALESDLGLEGMRCTWWVGQFGDRMAGGNEGGNQF